MTSAPPFPEKRDASSTICHRLALPRCNNGQDGYVQILPTQCPLFVFQQGVIAPLLRRRARLRSLYAISGGGA